MGRDRVLTPALGVFLALIGGIMLAALDSKWRRPALAEALRTLADGDLEGIERRRLLQSVLSSGRDRPERPLRVAAAAAAILLEDGVSYEHIAGSLAESGRHLRAGDLAAAEGLVTIEPVLGHLFAGLQAEDRGERPAAHAAFASAAMAGELWGMPLAKAIAAAGAERTR